jgi:hypothetical protein
MTTAEGRVKCQGFRKNGEPCGAFAVSASSAFCFWHDPGIAPDLKYAAAMKGGLMSRPKALPPGTPDVTLQSPEACLQLLQESVSAVRRGELDIKVMNSISYAVVSATKVWEVAISAKLNRLEKLVHGRVSR